MLFIIRTLTLLITSCSFFLSQYSSANNGKYKFDSAMVNGGDVTRFNDGQQLPGQYLVTVSVNDARKK